MSMMERATWSNQLQNSAIINDLSTNDRKHGRDALDGVVGHAILVQKIITQHHEVCQLAFFDRSKLIFFFCEPWLTSRIQPKCLHAGQCLSRSHELAGAI